MYIHLEVDEYKPSKLEDFYKRQQGNFSLKRMIPPRCDIKYYFSTDGMFNIIYA